MVFFCRIATAGRDAVDVVDVRLLDALQELPRIGGERLDIASLALGVNGVKGKGRLARSRHAGNHREGVVGDLKIDVFQVMDACAANNNAFRRHQDRAAADCNPAHSSVAGKPETATQRPKNGWQNLSLYVG